MEQPTADYDLELWELGTSPSSLVTASTNRQTGTQDPYEATTAIAAVRDIP